MKCDCEHEASGIVCGHKPGGCSNAAFGKVRLFGLGMNVCEHCFLMQFAPMPIDEKLKFDWFIPVDDYSSVVKSIHEEQDCQ
jgi:hypothetical protein